MFDYIKNTFYGRVPFVDTFIFFGIFGTSFLIMFFFTLENKYAFFLVNNQAYLYLSLIFISIYTIFLILSLYRSVKKSKFMKNFSFVSIVGVVMIFSMLTSSYLSNIYNPNKIFEGGILTLNDTLPMMIDKNMRFNKVYIKDGDIYYDYTMINSSLTKLNRDFFTLVMTDKVERTRSIDQLILKLSTKKRKILYIFKDKDENLITEVAIKL